MFGGNVATYLIGKIKSPLDYIFEQNLLNSQQRDLNYSITINNPSADGRNIA